MVAASALVAANAYAQQSLDISGLISPAQGRCRVGESGAQAAASANGWSYRAQDWHSRFRQSCARLEKSMSSARRFLRERAGSCRGQEGEAEKRPERRSSRPRSRGAYEPKAVAAVRHPPCSLRGETGRGRRAEAGADDGLPRRRRRADTAPAAVAPPPLRSPRYARRRVRSGAEAATPV